MQSYNELKALVAAMEDDVRKFYEKGNQTSGTRFRKQLADLKRKAQAIRTEVQTVKSLRISMKKSESHNH
jgi:hypothetical protein